MIDGSSNSGLHQQTWCRPAHQKIKWHDSLSCQHCVLWFCIRHQKSIFLTKPDISKACAMKYKTTICHELKDFRPGRRPASENRLRGDDAHRLSSSATSFHLPVDGKLLIDEFDPLQILVLSGKTCGSKLTPEFSSMRGFDDTNATLGKPYFVLGAASLAKALRQFNLFQNLRHSRFQNGSAEAVSRPADSNTWICASQSAELIGFWFWRYLATRLRSSARFCSMVSAPVGISSAYSFPFLSQ
jgi:hypothetical protein